jgi:DNA-directed RNA polymerase subunit RPC12/RpoP
MSSAALVTVAVAMHVRCAKCQCSIHLGALVDRVRCPKCGFIEPIPVERWQKNLDSVIHDGPALPDAQTQLVRDEDNFWIIGQKVTPKCQGCKQLLPITAAQNGRANGKCFCVGCGAKIGVRPVPDPLKGALTGITHLLGEDGILIKQPDAPIPAEGVVVAVKCPDCGGNIQPDGKSRAVRCPYCAVMVVLPQSVWRRLHTGKNEPHIFYLVHDPALPKPLGRADVEWSSLDGICCDPVGNVYGVGTDDQIGARDAYMVFALDHQLKTKWIQKNIEIEDDAHIAWRNDGVLLVWSERRYSGLLFRTGDGQLIGKVGGEQPKNHGSHILDLSRAKSLAIDFDGTFLFAKRNRLARCTPDGNGTFTWPPGQGLLGGLVQEKLRPFSEEDEDGYDDVENLGDRPTKVWDPAIRVGWDGRTYFFRSKHVACFDRSGKRLWKAEVPSSNDWDFGIDARGIVYVIRWLASDTHGIYRILPGGKEVQLLIDGRNPQTPMRDDRRIAVHPDGTMFLGDYGRSIRIYSPDGRLLYRSEKAIKDDTEWMEKEAKERSRDRVK